MFCRIFGNLKAIEGENSQAGISSRASRYIPHRGDLSLKFGGGSRVRNDWAELRRTGRTCD